MIDPARLYHIGIVVPDLAHAMDELGTALGYSWSGIREFGALRLAFARPGPPWLEVIEGPADSLWSAAAGATLHHLGYWVEDLEGESLRLEALGMELETARRDEEGRLARFVYHRNPQGGRIELADERARDTLERWITEGL